MNSRLRFHLPLDDKAALRLCSRPQLCLFWTSPLSHVKQWFVHSNETPTVTITFPVCHTDSPPVQYCLFRLYWDNGRHSLPRVPSSRSSPFSLPSSFLSLSNSPTPSLFLHPAEEEVMGTLTQLRSSHPITAETKRVLFPRPRYEVPQREWE